MREIKFRAWDKERKDMLYQLTQAPCFGLDEKDRACSIEDVLFYYKNDFELMQYTGLKDKNGKEIYEGDIVKYTFDLPESTYATEIGLKIRTDKIFWSDWRSSFSVGNQLANNDLFRYVRNGNRVEVIGNIYENPELLEAQDV